jgi:hypothetical protein
LSGSITIDPDSYLSGLLITFSNVVTHPNGSTLPPLIFNNDLSYGAVTVTGLGMAPNQAGYDPGFLSMWGHMDDDYMIQLSIPYTDAWSFPQPLNISSQNYPLHVDDDGSPYTGSHIFYCSGAGCENGVAEYNITGGSLQPITLQAVAEPSSLMFLASGLLSLAINRARRARKPAGEGTHQSLGATPHQ